MALTCSSCNINNLFDDDFKAHCKSPFHTFNLKRKVAGLGPISQEVWEEKKRAAEAAKSDGGESQNRAWLQKQAKYEKKKLKAGAKSARARVETPEEEAAEATAEPEPRPYVPEEPWTVKHCLFETKVFDSMEENLAYMGSKYSFFIPDREYVKDLDGLVLCLAEKVQKDFTCLFCNRIFRSMQACRAHMIDSGHTMIGTHSDTLLGEIGDYYDYSESHKELVAKLGVKPKAAAPADEDTTAESGEDEEGEWEECDSDASGEVLEVVECDDEDQFADVLERYGLQNAELLETGDLRLPNGKVACHRSVAYVYRQKFHTRADRSDIVDEKRRQLCLTGVRGATNGAGAVVALAVGARQVKRQNRQVLAIMRQQNKDWAKLGLVNSKGDIHGRNMPVKVNLYSWAK
jgi:pre-60S factor REI1